MVSHPFTEAHIGLQAITVELGDLLSEHKLTQPAPLDEDGTVDEGNIPHSPERGREPRKNIV